VSRLKEPEGREGDPPGEEQGEEQGETYVSLRGAVDQSGPRHRQISILQSFNYAFDGVIYTLRTQRNMRIHFAVATVVLVLAFAYDVTKIELIALLLAIAFVLVTEKINTAIEAATDVATTSFNPLAKLAKDIAAGAVLVSSVTALAIGYLVLADRVRQPTNHALEELRDAPVHLTVIALVVVILLVIAVKAITGRGTPLRGGLPSGHAALAFAGWAAITFVTEGFTYRVLVSTVAFIMACLVAQTRVESGMHSGVEVVLGGVLGSVTTLVLFQAFG
jgi:diacylglycerol kinase (ATP)